MVILLMMEIECRVPADICFVYSFWWKKEWIIIFTIDLFLFSSDAAIFAVFEWSRHWVFRISPEVLSKFFKWEMRLTTVFYSFLHYIQVVTVWNKLHIKISAKSWDKAFYLIIRSHMKSANHIILTNQEH